MGDARRTVVVGYDGSPAAEIALEWAAHEALRRATGLTLLHTPPLTGPAVWWGIPLTDGVLQGGQRLLLTAAERLRGRLPQVRVTLETVVDEPAVALVEASRTAAVVVVGARGRGRITGPLLGSVSQKVSAHAHGPVVVVRGTEPVPGGPVVVGVDPLDGAPEALTYAFEEAQRRGVGVVAVQAAQEEDVHGLPVGHDDELLRATRRRAERVARERVEGWARRYPDVPATLELAYAHPIEALSARAQDAGLLVVGSRGRGGLAGLLLGSVSRGVLQHAPVVAVVRVGAG
ncbi:universal stress protein [Georgenia sp. 10Sc9-8]|uniref:Universal stress protein n=1 Tax=Georgenia halotolerans TaxID=3028317 RepID=A0ABT5U1J1_9MICO|nr:universal stress protein [Georgenia halotolerans]